MIKILDLENIKIVGKNSKYKGRSIRTHSPEYNSFREIFEFFLRQNKNKYEEGDKLYFDFYMYHDIDAPLTCILDAMQRSGFVKDDRIITNIDPLKVQIKKGRLGRIKIYLEKGGARQEIKNN